MFNQLIQLALQNLLYLALHLETNSVFPKPLSAKDEKYYFELLASGDTSAKNKLIEHNLRLVAHIVKKYCASSAEQEDLISIGTIGLIKAVGTFDCSKNIRFATYACRCIENEILMNFRSSKKSADDIYIDSPIDTDKDGNQLTIMDLISDNTCSIEEIDLRIKSQQLYKFISASLDEREITIITERYGLFGHKPLTQKEVAKKLNISRSYVSRIEKKALQKLKKKFDKTPLFE